MCQYSAFILHCLGFTYTLSHESSSYIVIYMQVSVLTLYILGISVPTSFFPLPLLGYGMFSQLFASYLESQFAFGKHVYPQRFGDVSFNSA
jgi:hypothetical protein